MRSGPSSGTSANIRPATLYTRAPGPNGYSATVPRFPRQYRRNAAPVMPEAYSPRAQRPRTRPPGSWQTPTPDAAPPPPEPLSLISMTDAGYRITGGRRLEGRVRVSGSKNGADYAVAAALLTDSDVVLHNVPEIGDVRQMVEILAHLGATVDQHGDIFDIKQTAAFRGQRVVLDSPSVMGTLNVMLAATLADGVTTIINAACEPEIESLAVMLNGMGAKITAAGTPIMGIEGVSSVGGVEHRIIPDRLEAGTFALAAAITRGKIEIEEAVPEHLDALIWKMREAGAFVESTDGGMRVTGAASYAAVNAQALPYPGLATDLQPQLATFLTQASGTSTIHERVFDNRLLYITELRKLGANVVATGQTAIITGPTRLTAAPVQALDVRAGTACVLAALVAEGATEISDVYHVERAHDDLHGKLRALGAEIERA